MFVLIMLMWTIVCLCENASGFGVKQLGSMYILCVKCGRMMYYKTRKYFLLFHKFMLEIYYFWDRECANLAFLGANADSYTDSKKVVLMILFLYDHIDN